MKTKKLIGSVVLGAMLAATPMAAFAGTLTMNLGSRVATMDADTIVMENAAGVTEDGMIMVPVRAVAEAYGGTVVYDGEAHTVRMDFPNGNWAVIEVQMDDAEVGDDGSSIVSVAKFVNDRMYIPADLMAVCLGGKVSYVDYGKDHVYRLIYHVR